jgi:peptide/nickel transport system permease protein
VSARGRGLVGYALGRLASTAAIVLLSLALLFALTLLVPGDPASTLLGPRATPEAITDFRLRMGLDLPVWERLARFIGQVLSGDLGSDLISGRPILTMTLEALPHTVALTFGAMALALAAGAPLGVYAATHPGSALDQLFATLSVAAIAIPSYVVAIFLLMVFALKLDWLPALGVGDGSLGSALSHLALPAVALAVGWIGYIARLMRASMLEALGEPYIRTARAYGLPERQVLWKYALKNACIPTLAVLGIGVGKLLGGAVFIEILFARPGLGKLLYDAISVRNYPVVQGCVLLVVLLFVLANLVVDLLYAWLDPRVRASYAERRGAA